MFICTDNIVQGSVGNNNLDVQSRSDLSNSRMLHLSNTVSNQDYTPSVKYSAELYGDFGFSGMRYIISHAAPYIRMLKLIRRKSDIFQSTSPSNIYSYVLVGYEKNYSK